MTVLKKISLWLKYPYFLLKYDPSWDKRLNDLLDQNEFTDISECTVTIGGIELWIADHPYISFVPIAQGSDEIEFTTGRPSRATIDRASLRLSQKTILHDFSLN